MCSILGKIIFQLNQNELLLIYLDQETNLLVVRVLCTVTLEQHGFELHKATYMCGFQLTCAVQTGVGIALAAVAQWIEGQSANQKVTGMILRAHAWVAGQVLGCGGV